MEGGGLGIQWWCEQTFASGEATDETSSGGKGHHDYWTCMKVNGPRSVIPITRQPLFEIESSFVPLHSVETLNGGG